MCISFAECLGSLMMDTSRLIGIKEGSKGNLGSLMMDTSRLIGIKEGSKGNLGSLLKLNPL
jgi:hypothetical protein